MAVLKVLKCRECFFPLPDGVLECPKCHTVHKIVNEAPVNPLMLPPNVTNDYVEFFKQKTEENPKDTNALFGMGLVYMGLKNYELAQRNFKEAADQQPKEPDVYYYFALSLFEGHNPRELSDTVTKRIEEWLHTATNIHQKRKYLILQMVLRQGAFIARGLQIKGEQPAELMEKIRTLMPEADDLVEIEQHVQIDDPQTKRWLDELKHGKPAGDKGRQKGTRISPTPSDQYNICYNTTERDMDYSDPSDPANSVGQLLFPETRYEFFDYQYPFEEPQPRQLPFYPVMGTLWRIVKMVIFTVIMFIAVVATDFGFGEYKNKDAKALYDKWEQEYKDDHNGKKPDAKLRKEKKAKFEEDAKEEQEKYPNFFEDYYVFSYEDADTEKPVFKMHITAPIEDANVKSYSGIEKTWKGPFAIFLVLLPFLYYLIRIIITFTSISRERRSLRAANKEDRDNYEYSMHKHMTRPTKRDYIDFCRHFLAKSSPWLAETGDPVTQALREHRVDELDMAGKVLFVNYFEYENDDEEETEHPDEVLRYLYYIIAVPQRDKLLIMNNKWDTTENEFEHCSVETIYYDKILSMNYDGEEIDIKLVGGTGNSIVLPSVTKTSLLAYQSNDPSDVLTFSNTRTSDPQDFVKALETLRAAFR